MVKLPKLARYLVVGVINTALGLGTIFVARHFVADTWANLIGYVVVVPISFLGYRQYAFRDNAAVPAAIARYLIAIGLGYLANRLVLDTSLTHQIDPYIAQTLGIVAHIAVCYVLLSRVVFTRQTSQVFP